MRVKKGGSDTFCPHCKKTRVCKAVNASEVCGHSGRHYYFTNNKDVNWVRRGRVCLTCHKCFLTAEVDEAFLDELVELRSALGNIKANAEQYLAEAKSASASLEELTKSLNILKALQVYKDA